MAIKNEYLKGIYAGLVQRNPEQKEYLQAVEEVVDLSGTCGGAPPRHRPQQGHRPHR